MSYLKTQNLKYIYIFNEIEGNKGVEVIKLYSIRVNILILFIEVKNNTNIYVFRTST